MSPSDDPSTIDELLDGALEALNRGDTSTAFDLAERVLAIDHSNADAGDLLAAPSEHGEIRRLTILFADLVDSTVLSSRVEPEAYRSVVGGYRDIVRAAVARFEGFPASTKGDGLLALFGHPQPHENDAARAVQAALDISRRVAELDDSARRRFGVSIQVRVGVHRGLVYLDTAEDDVYGLGANLAARLCGLADPNTVVVSEGIERLIRDRFELEARPAKPVKGLEEDVAHFRVVSERDPAHRFDGPLIGRGPERTYLGNAWSQATRGALQTPGVAILAEAGIGKSRLADVAVTAAERDGATVLELLGSPFHGDVGLYPIRRLLERNCEIDRAAYPAERLRRLREELDRRHLDPDATIPLLAPVLGIAPDVGGYRPVAADGRKLFEQITGAVLRYLLACLPDGPALILAEDTHWFDEDTREILAKLVDDVAPGVLIVMTSRSANSVPGGDRVARLDLLPLTDPEAEQLILAVHPDATPEARAAVLRRCDGVPFFIEEISASVRQSGFGETQQVPDTLYEALLSRLRSSQNAVRIVEAAATIGPRIDRGLLLAVADVTEEHLDAVLAELTEARVFESAGPQTWRFRHELLREVAAEVSPPSFRRKLHSRIADSLASASRRGNEDWLLAAGHYVKADRYADAVDAFVQASQDASRRGALQEARNHLTSALVQVEQMTAGTQRTEIEVAVRLRRGYLSSAAEGLASPNSAADFERCLALSGDILGTDEFFATLVALYGFYAMRADLHRVEALLTSVRNEMQNGREWFRSFNSAGFGMLAWYRGEFDAALELLAAAAGEQTEEDAAAVEAVWFMPNEPIASVYTHLALAQFVKGDLAGAEENIALTRQRCDRSGFPEGPFSLAYCDSLEVLIRTATGQHDLARRATADLVRGADEHGFDSWTMVGMAAHTTVEALASIAAGTADADTLAAPISFIETYIAGCHALQLHNLLTYYHAGAAEMMLAASRVDDARAQLDMALGLSAATGMACWDAELHRLYARTRVDDDVQGRERDLRAALELARRQGATAFQLNAAVDLFRLLGEPARPELAAAIAGFPAASSWPPLRPARELLDPARAESS